MIKAINLNQFSVFEQAQLEFSPGLNVLIGANATGKTHLLKLAYSVVSAWRDFQQQHSSRAKNANGPLEDRLKLKLKSVFRPDDGALGRLVCKMARRKSTVEVELDEGRLTFSLTPLGRLSAGRVCATGELPASVFLPARDVLSIYPGFMAAYRNRELAFDETYYDLCHLLSGSPLRGPRAEAASALWQPLGQHAHTTVAFERDRFYLVSDEDGVIEAHLAAEGLRKIATIMHLIANGSLTKNTVLFWDEPEANLNPRLIKVVADFMLQLAAHEIQIFIASHDYLLTNQLSLNAEYQTEAALKAPVRFFAFSRGSESGVRVESGTTLAELESNPIMDEFAALYERERGLFYANGRPDGEAARVDGLR